MATELHVLNDSHMERRAAGEDSYEALRGTAERLYAQLVDRRQQHRPAALLDPAPLRPLPALGLAGRRRRPVLLPPGRPLPRRGDPPPARELAALLPALAPRRGDPRRHDLRPARERARPRGLRAPRRRTPAPAAPRPTLEDAFDARFRDIEEAWRDYLREMARPGGVS